MISYLTIIRFLKGWSLPGFLRNLLSVFTSKGDYAPSGGNINLKMEVRPVQESAEYDLEDMDRIISSWFSTLDNINRNISMYELADELNIKRIHIMNYFNIALNKNFRTFKEEKRIDMAKQILCENSFIQVNRVAEMLKFKDKSNFHRQFKKYAGCTPKEWRDTNGHPEMIAENNPDNH